MRRQAEPVGCATKAYGDRGLAMNVVRVADLKRGNIRPTVMADLPINLRWNVPSSSDQSRGRTVLNKTSCRSSFPQSVLDWIVDPVSVPRAVRWTSLRCHAGRPVRAQGERTSRSGTEDDGRQLRRSSPPTRTRRGSPVVWLEGRPRSVFAASMERGPRCELPARRFTQEHGASLNQGPILPYAGRGALI